MLPINNPSSTGKLIVFFAVMLGFRNGAAARANVASEWDTYQLFVAKRYRSIQARDAPAAPATGSDNLELAPGVPMPEELKAVVNAM